MYFSATASSEKDDGMPVKRSRRPLQRRLPDLFLDIGNDLTGIGRVPAPVQVFGRDAQLNDEIAREVLGLDLTALLLPEPEESALIIAHDDPGVRTPMKNLRVEKSDLFNIRAGRGDVGHCVPPELTMNPCMQPTVEAGPTIVLFAIVTSIPKAAALSP